MSAIKTYKMICVIKMAVPCLRGRNEDGGSGSVILQKVKFIYVNSLEFMSLILIFYIFYASVSILKITENFERRTDH